jgi:hypothetical protein
MKRVPKSKDSITFRVSSHIIEVCCIMRPLFNINERAYNKKTCSMLFAHEDNRITKIVVSDMKAAVYYIINNLDFNTMTVNTFGNSTIITKVILQRNLKWFTIKSIDGKECNE